VMDTPVERDITPGRGAAPAQIGMAARPALIESDERARLIKEMEVAAKGVDGAAALAALWGTTFDKAKRKLVGPEELERIKHLAEETARDAQVAAGRAAESPATNTAAPLPADAADFVADMDAAGGNHG
jgi:hypothetical protein